MLRFEVKYEPNHITYNDKDFCWLLLIYIDDTCWYIGRHETLNQVMDKVTFYKKSFDIE